MINVLHLSSTALALLSSDRGAGLYQPCFAAKENEQWTFDNLKHCQFHTDALDHSVNTYFLDCSKAEAIIQGTAKPLDLVYEQLNRFLGDLNGNLILVLSSVYSNSQIKCLSGVLQLMADSIAIVKSPLAYSYTLPSGRHLLLEMEMHDAILTELEISDGLAKIQETRRLPNQGLQCAYNEQYLLIRDQFVDRHRYNTDHVTGNKSLLLQQLYEHWSDDNTNVQLKINDYEVFIDKEELKRKLPNSLLEYIGNQPCWLIPSPVIPLEYIFSEVKVLPYLDKKYVTTLTQSPSLQYLETANKSTDLIRVFHTIDYQQVE